MNACTEHNPGWPHYYVSPRQPMEVPEKHNHKTRLSPRPVAASGRPGMFYTRIPQVNACTVSAKRLKYERLWRWCSTTALTTQAVRMPSWLANILRYAPLASKPTLPILML